MYVFANPGRSCFCEHGTTDTHAGFESQHDANGWLDATLDSDLKLTKARMVKLRCKFGDQSDKWWKKGLGNIVPEGEGKLYES